VSPEPEKDVGAGKIIQGKSNKQQATSNKQQETRDKRQSRMSDCVKSPRDSEYLAEGGLGKEQIWRDPDLDQRDQKMRRGRRFENNRANSVQWQRVKEDAIGRHLSVLTCLLTCSLFSLAHYQ